LVNAAKVGENAPPEEASCCLDKALTKLLNAAVRTNGRIVVQKLRDWQKSHRKKAKNIFVDILATL
jgi:hypothetical protein